MKFCWQYSKFCPIVTAQRTVVLCNARLIASYSTSLFGASAGAAGSQPCPPPAPHPSNTFTQFGLPRSLSAIKAGDNIFTANWEKIFLRISF